MSQSAGESPSRDELQRPQLALSSGHAVRAGRVLWDAVSGVLRERRARRPFAAGGGPLNAVEAEVLNILYGDARVRRRAYDIQPSHVRPDESAVRR